MLNFSLNQNSLEVAQTIIENHREIISIKLISHKVETNWRQLYKSTEDKVLNLNRSFIHTLPIQQKIYKREEFIKLKLNDLNKLGDSQVWSLCSKVECEDGEYKHIPMMNFHPEGISLEIIKQSIKHIYPNKNGVILHSGRFFHYYGNFLLSENEWIKFMAAFLMPCVLVSSRYIGHRLHDGYCSLRLTTDTKYKTKIPEVILVL